MADLSTVRDLETRAAIAAALLREQIDLLRALREAHELVPELTPAIAAARVSIARLGRAFAHATNTLEAILEQARDAAPAPFN
jgi:hypothetical protein